VSRHHMQVVPVDESSVEGAHAAPKPPCADHKTNKGILELQCQE
jgi:hypothetical protein